MEKKCIKCGVIKPFDQFTRNRICKDGVTNECKECNSIRSKEYRERISQRTQVKPQISEKIKEELTPLENIPGRLLILELRRRGYAGELVKTTIEKVVI